MKIFFGVIFGLILLVGAALIVQMTSEQQESYSVDRYITTKGATSAPASWRGKLGEGI